MKGYTGMLAILVMPILLFGCAQHTRDIQATEVSARAYKGLSCPEILAELGTNTRRLEELSARVDKTADDDEAAMAIGMILFWPMLFALDGKDTPDARQYALLKGERVALEHVVTLNDCPRKPSPLRIAGSSSDATAGSASSAGDASQSVIHSTPALKIGILPFDYLGLGVHGGDLDGLYEESRVYLERDKRFQLVYNYDDKYVERGVAISDADVWNNSAVNKEPRLDRVLSIGERLGWDVAVMLFVDVTLRSDSNEPDGDSDVYGYIIDIKSKKQYHRRGRVDRLTPLMEALVKALSGRASGSRISRTY